MVFTISQAKKKKLYFREIIEDKQRSFQTYNFANQKIKYHYIELPKQIAQL